MREATDYQGLTIVNTYAMGEKAFAPTVGEYLISEFTGIVYQVINDKEIKTGSITGYIMANTETGSIEFYNIERMRVYIESKEGLPDFTKPNPLLIWLENRNDIH